MKITVQHNHNGKSNRFFVILTGISVLFGILSVLLIAFYFLVPKFLAKNLEKNHRLDNIKPVLEILQISPDYAISEIRKIRSSEVKKALSELNEKDIIKKNDSISYFFIEKFDLPQPVKQKIFDQLENEKVKKEATSILINLYNNKNKTFFVIPVLKRTLIEILHKTSKQR